MRWPNRGCLCGGPILGGYAGMDVDLLPLAFGGNKLRNLEFLVGAALAVGERGMSVHVAPYDAIRDGLGAGSEDRQAHHVQEHAQLNGACGVHPTWSNLAET